MGASKSAGNQHCSCKVGTVAAEYGLDAIHRELQREWTGENSKSVRELTTKFNRRVLRAAYAEAGKLPIDGEIANIYRVLTASDVDAGSRTRAREQLRQAGVAVDDVESKFVSHQTLYRHLVNCLDAEFEPEEKTDAERIETWEERLLALQNRTSNVTKQAVEQLSERDTVDIGSFDVLLEINVLCEDCGNFYTLEEFLQNRACGCHAVESEQ